MENLFSYIIKSLVSDNYSKLRIKVVNTDSEIFFNIYMPVSLRNSLVGRDSKILNALKDYFRTVSRKFGNKKVFIRVNEV